MNHLRRFPLLCFVLALLAISGFCLVTGAVELLVVAGVLAAISWFVTEGPRGRTLPRWVSNVLVLGLLVNMLLEAQAAPDELPSVLGRFTVWLTLVKLYERRTARDHGQLMGLGLLLMLIGAAEMPPPLLFGLLLVVYLALGLYCVLLYQLYAGHERVAELRRRGHGVGLTASRPSTGRRTGVHLRLLATGTGLATVAVGIGIFLLFPRHVGQGFAAPGTGGSGTGEVSGLSRTIDLRSGRRITDSPREVLRVETIPPPGVPHPIESGTVLRLRASTLDRYEGDGSWSASSDRVRRIETTGGAALQPLLPAGVPPPEPGPPTWRQTIDLVVGDTRLLHLGLPLLIGLPEGGRTLAVEPRSGVLEVVAGPRVRRYEMVSVLDPSAPSRMAMSGGPAMRPPERRIAGVFDDPRHPVTEAVRAEALRLLGAADLLPPRPGSSAWIRGAAEAFDRHLRAGPFRYTLDLSDVPPAREPGALRDPVVRFLLETRRGHCEYFAAAFVALCQSIGIQARVVVGYAATEPARAPRTHVVRARDAHAWAEVRTGPWTWRTFDATPPGVLEPREPEADTIGTRVGTLYERLEGTWNDRFVGFDPTAQSEIFGALDRGRDATLGTWLRRLREWASEVNRAFRFGPAGYVWLGIVGFAAAIALVAVGRWIARRRRIRRGLGLGAVPALSAERYVRSLDFYFDMLDALARRGLPKPAWQPPLAWAETVARRRPELADDVRAISEAYYAGRFGGRLPRAEELDRLRARAAGLAAPDRGRRGGAARRDAGGDRGTPAESGS